MNAIQMLYFSEPATAAGESEERMNGCGRRVPATGAHSKMAVRLWWAHSEGVLCGMLA